MSLQKPPSPDQPSRILLRILVLIVLVLAAGVAVWTAVTNQRIDLVEDVAASSLELEDPSLVDGTRLNVVSEPGGPVPVILIHDFDITGSSLWDDVASGLGGRFKAVRIDLPGYGLSDRIPDEGPAHTVASMAGVVGTVVEERFEIPVVLVGVGMGGQVAAELAATNPDLVRGLVMIDVDFWAEEGWEEFFERLPWVGRAVTYTLETGGQFGREMWAPNCATGGWCPSESQARARRAATEITGSTDSIRSHLRTLPSSLVPSELTQIESPVAFVWSTGGAVPGESVDRVLEKIPEMKVSEVVAWKAHLEAPQSVLDAIDLVGR